MRKTKRMLALSLAAAMLAAQPAYANQVVTAAQPEIAGAEGTYISSIGPEGTKEVGDDGYVAVGSNGRNANEYVNAGPGAGGLTGTGTEASSSGGSSIIISGQQQTASQTGTASSEAAPGGGTVSTGTAASGTAASGTAQITIDESIQKPSVSSEAAVLYDATTGQVLFDKNANQQMYPASMTKLMTALLVAENCSLDDTVTYSETATHGLESGAATVQLDTGDTLSVRDSLYALLLKSACEVANGLAEKVSGTQAAFAELMNQRAQQLGCTNTHFANASGLNDTNHYTTAYDMALITKAAFDNETVRTIASTVNYTLPAAKNRGELAITNGNKMINPANSQHYDGIIGGKTGYTSKAGNTLATAVQKDGHELIAVVMKSTQQQYTDTKALLDYGYQLIAAAKGNTGTDQSQSQTQTGTAGWIQVSDTQWQYKKADGTLCRSEWLDLNGTSYWFDDNTYMATGWRQFSNGAWYYFNPQNGAMVTNKWVTDNGKSYYLQSDGTMAVNTVIDGTYQVDANGVYVKKLK